MSERKKVIIGLSGGVDSATAVHFLKEAGFEVIGLTLKMLPDEIERSCAAGEGFRVCCSKEAVMEAKICAMKLGISHYVINCAEDFENKIIDYFASDYLAARTPNPCVFCNKYIKFKYLLGYAAMMGADYVSTGHYADIAYSETYGRRLLCKPADEGRDQSYMLCMLPFEYIEKIILPLGPYRKSETRAYAEKLGLIVADKPDSQEICFVPDGDYAGFIAGRKNCRAQIKAGNIVDLKGKILARHNGLINYTVGQRRGLNIAHKEPLYVVKLDPARNEVIVTEAAFAAKTEFFVRELNLHCGTPFIDGREYEVKIRYKHNAVKAVISASGDKRARVTLSKAERGVTPGQILAVYDGRFLLGGAVIE
jgi:tRNA-specific 2-thiouridylase